MHVALLHQEVVRRRGWLSEERFLDLVGASNLIPGPNSTELAIHIGYERAGWRGLLVAGLGFLVPAVVLTFLLAWLYVSYGTRPEAEGLLRGLRPVLLALVTHAFLGLGKRATRTPWLATLAGLSAIAAFLGVHELVVLFGAAALQLLVSGVSWTSKAAGLAPLALLGAPAAATPLALFLIFLKIGSVLFGSGYVLIAYLRADFVTRLGWLTERQLLDAIAAGQATPGPVFSAGTFVGFLLAGPWGAVAATLGIFLPAFVLVALTAPLVPKLRASKGAATFLDGVNAASLALLFVVAIPLARAAYVDPIDAIVFGLALLALFRSGWNPTWLVLSGAVYGALRGLTG